MKTNILDTFRRWYTPAAPPAYVPGNIPWENCGREFGPLAHDAACEACKRREAWQMSGEADPLVWLNGQVVPDIKTVPARVRKVGRRALA